MMATRFDGMDLLAAQLMYRDLIMRYHPDNAETGNAAEATTVNAEWQAFTAHVVNDAFSKAEAERTGRTGDYSASAFADMLRKIIKWPVRVEIIGFWIYAFDSFKYHDQLKELGFWFSAKHKAWIYSGGKKRPIRGWHTTDQNRAKWGSQSVASEYREEATIPA